MLIIAGCGGSGAAKPAAATPVHGNGYSFQAPAGWKIEHTSQQASATHGSELVRVATFPLVKPYTAGLFGRVAVELKARMADVARQTGGTVDGGRTVTAGGIRAHSYRVTVGDHVDEYTFVLRGMREFQLLCRRAQSHDETFCARLVASFQPG